MFRIIIFLLQSSIAVYGLIQQYEFNVTYNKLNLDGRGPAWVQTINGQVPGPLITAYQGDTLQIKIRNDLATESVAFRWHGMLHSKNLAYLDGARGISQCPLPPGAVIDLSWEVQEQPGTYIYWETEPSSVASRGLYGSVVVLEREEIVDEFDVVTVSDFFRKPIGALLSQSHGRLSAPASSSALQHRVGIFPLDAVLINGKVNGTVLSARKLRLVNTASVFSFKVSLQDHAFDIVSVDASPVVPYRCRAVILAPGERFDVLVVEPSFSNRESCSLIVETLEREANRAEADWRPVELEENNAIVLRNVSDLPIVNCFDVELQSPTCLPITVLHPIKPQLAPPIDPPDLWEVVMRATSASGLGHFVRLKNNLSVKEREVDAWKSKHLAGKFIQHQLPRLPVLTHGDLHPHSIVLDAQHGQWIDIVFNAIDRQAVSFQKNQKVRILQVSTDAIYFRHLFCQVPWHLSGHKFLVLGIGHADPSVDCNLIRCETPWFDGSIVLEEDNSVWKDTVVIPPGGWVKIRFKAQRGLWSLASSSEPLSADGLGILLRVRDGSNDVKINIPPKFQELCDVVSNQLTSTACSCREDPGMIFDSGPRASYKCSRPHLCLHAEHGTIITKDSQAWRAVLPFLAVLSFFMLYLARKRRRRMQHKQVDEVNHTPQTSPRSNNDTFSIIPQPTADINSLVVPTIPGQVEEVDDGAYYSGTSTGSYASPNILSPKQTITGEASDVALAMSRGSLRQRRGSFGRKRESVTQRAECLSTYRSFVLDCHNDMRLVWAGLTVSMNNRPILDGVAGAMNPGEMLAIIGPSGSGKTLLLNLLAGTRLKNEAKLTDGAILFGGMPLHAYSQDSLRSLRSFLGEDQMQYATASDGSMGGFTVFELLTFYAQLQKPRELLDDAIIESYVYEGIIHVGLEGLAGTRIKSLSSSQRRRVALCAELLFPRPILLLDDAFLGIDSNSKMNLALWCKEIATEIGAIIVMTISSPPSKVLPIFNKLLILQRGGYPVFFGPTEKAPDYFEGVGMRVPPYWNPSDWYMEVLDFNKNFPRIESGGVDWDDLEGLEFSHLSQWVYCDDSSSNSDSSATDSSKPVSSSVFTDPKHFVTRLSGQISSGFQTVRSTLKRGSSSSSIGEQRADSPTGSRRNSRQKRHSQPLRCPSAESNPDDDISSQLTEQMIASKIASASEHTSSERSQPHEGQSTMSKTPPLTPPRVSLAANMVRTPSETTPRQTIKQQTPTETTPRQSLFKRDVTPPSLSPRTSFAKGTPARSPRTSMLEETRTPPKVTPPATQRNSLAPPGGLQDNIMEEVSQRSSVVSNASSATNSPDNSKRPSRRSGINVPHGEGSLGNVQVRATRRSRTGQRESEVSLNVQLTASKGVSSRLSRQRSWGNVNSSGDSEPGSPVYSPGGTKRGSGSSWFASREVIKFKRSHRPFKIQVKLLLAAEMRAGLDSMVHMYKFIEVFGLATVAGLVWLGRGQDNTVTGLRETVGLFFFTTASWSLPPVFAALTGIPSLLARVRVESSRSFYSLGALVLARTISDLCFMAVWPFWWIMVAYSMAGVGRSVFHVLQFAVIVAVHTLAMQSFALSLGVLTSRPQLTMIVVNIFCQFWLAAAGFYTVLPDWVHWITYISLPRYTFKALIKLEYGWQDVFSADPYSSVQIWGYPATQVPAELTSVFEEMHRRQMGVMKSPENLMLTTEMLVLLGVMILGRLVLWWSLQKSVKQQEMDFQSSALVAERTGDSHVPDSTIVAYCKEFTRFMTYPIRLMYNTYVLAKDVGQQVNNIRQSRGSLNLSGLDLASFGVGARMSFSRD